MSVKNYDSRVFILVNLTFDPNFVFVNCVNCELQCGGIKTWNDIRQEIKAKEDLEKSLCETLNDSSKLDSFIKNHSYSYLQNWEDYGNTILNDSGNLDSFKRNIF